MIDNLNPTNQFHPYQPVNDTPNAEKVKSGLGSFNWRDPRFALGALAALAIGFGLMRGRR